MNLSQKFAEAEARIRHAYTKQPKWLNTGTIPLAQACVISELIISQSARCAIEIGTASGFSAISIYTALDLVSKNSKLHTVDIDSLCYFNRDRRIGEAFLEVVGEQSNVEFHVNSKSFDIPGILGSEKAEFAFIDGSHLSPWAAIDLLAILGNLQLGAVVALDDIRLPFMSDTGRLNAARDLYRSWRGEKWVDARAPNLGILRFTDVEQALDDIATCLLGEWERPLTDSDLERIFACLQRWSHVPYTRKHTSEQKFITFPVIIAATNPFTNVSARPFLQLSQLHPNESGDDQVVTWLDVRVDYISTIEVRAVAGNPKEQNPGAVLCVWWAGEKDVATVDLQPRKVTSAKLETPRGRGKADLKIKVMRQQGQSSNCSAVTLFPLLTQSCNRVYEASDDGVGIPKRSKSVTGNAAEQVFITGAPRTGTSIMMRAVRTVLPRHLQYDEGHVFDLLPGVNRAMEYFFTIHKRHLLGYKNFLLNNINADDIRRDVNQTISDYIVKTLGGDEFIDKTPESAQIDALPFISELFPNGKAIILVRRAIECQRSAMVKFGDWEEYPNIWDEYLKIWIDCMNAVRSVKDRLGDFALIVEHRDIVVNPERVSAALATHLFKGEAAAAGAAMLEVLTKSTIEKTEGVDFSPISIDDLTSDPARREDFIQKTQDLFSYFRYTYDKDYIRTAQ